jgi:hypothetical protein
VLDEYKEIYKQSAALVPEWKTMSQVELAEKCSQKGPHYQNYLSALILKFWHIIDRNVCRDKGIYDELTAYDWYINAIMVVINYKVWKDPKSSVYNDAKAVEKMLNTCVNCDRANWFQASNRYKRKINHGINSLDSLTEEYGDSVIPIDLHDDRVDFSNCKELVLDYFNKQQYLMALIIDVIMNDLNIELVVDDRTLVYQVKKCIKSLPDTYFESFALNYGLDKDLVKKSFSYIYNMSDNRMKSSIEGYIYKLRSIFKKD